MKKIPPRQIFLLAVLAISLLLFAKEYIEKISLPTNGRIQEKILELQSARDDLRYARQVAVERERDMAKLNVLATPYWVPANSGKIEQEINAEISKLLRRSQLQATQKVDTVRERNGSFLQEVYVSLDMKNISMQALTRFMKELSTYSNGNKFRWDSCKISPDNAKTPKGVNASIKFKVLVLNDDAIKLLNN